MSKFKCSKCGRILSSVSDAAGIKVNGRKYCKSCSSKIVEGELWEQLKD